MRWIRLEFHVKYAPTRFQSLQEACLADCGFPSDGLQFLQKRNSIDVTTVFRTI